MNDEIQELAEQLVTLDPAADSALIKTIFSRILEFEYSANSIPAAQKFVDDVYYVPLIKSEIRADIWLETIKYLTGYNLKNQKWNYDPGKATFTTAFRYILTKRKGERFPDIPDSLEERLETLGEAGEPADDSEPNIGGLKVIDGFAKLAPLIAERKKAEEHLGKSKRGFFEGFFTFYITESLRITGFLSEEEVVHENNTLYPAVDTVVTDYLLIGDVGHMRDVARNELKDIKLFDKKYEVIAVCYGITRQTAGTRYQKYRELAAAL